MAHAHDLVELAVSLLRAEMDAACHCKFASRAGFRTEVDSAVGEPVKVEEIDNHSGFAVFVIENGSSGKPLIRAEVNGDAGDFAFSCFRNFEAERVSFAAAGGNRAVFKCGKFIFGEIPCNVVLREGECFCWS